MIVTSFDSYVSYRRGALEAYRSRLCVFKCWIEFGGNKELHYNPQFEVFSSRVLHR